MLWYANPPPKKGEKNQLFCSANVSLLLDTRKHLMRNTKIQAFSCVQSCIEQRRAGIARGTVIQEIRPGSGLQTGDVVKERLGGLP